MSTLSMGSARIWLNTANPGLSETDAEQGNLWLNTTSGRIFACSTETMGAQVWLSAAGVGGYVQSVTTQTTTYTNVTATIPYDDTIPQNTEGTEIMSVSITPTSATNNLIILASVTGSHSNALTTVMITSLFQDTTANALATVAISTDLSYWDNACLQYQMVAGTTSATTFKIRVGCNLNGFEVNGQGGSRKFGGASVCALTVMEISV